MCAKIIGKSSAGHPHFYGGTHCLFLSFLTIGSAAAKFPTNSL
jgi:hypothetical protein